MNEVSWKRILEQVDGQEPFEQRSAVADADRRQRHAVKESDAKTLQKVDWSGLETELKQVTQMDSAAKRGPSQRQANRHRPSPGQHAKQLQMRMLTKAHSVTPPEPPKRASKSNGARNLIAITLSITVVGFAGYKLSKNSPHNANNPDQIASFMDLAGSSTISSAERAVRIRATGTTRLDLRPSLATHSSWSNENLSAQASPPEIATTDAAQGLSLTPKQLGINANKKELSIVKRGHEILKQGQVKNARLIFEYLADRGSALGAFALAQTYDARFISHNELPEDSANKDLAFKWYQLAADLTSKAAR